MAADSTKYTKGLSRLLPNMDISSLDPALVDNWTDENGNPIDKNGDLKTVKAKANTITTVAPVVNPIAQANSKLGVNIFSTNKDGKVVFTPTGNASLDKIYQDQSKELEAKTLEFNKSENALAKKATIGNLALNAGAGILGLGQAIGGAKILNNTKAPKYPYELLPNQQLSARLGDVQRLSQIGDPVIREKMYRDLVLEKAKQDAVAQATSGGDISSYAAQTQANANRNTDSIRDIATSELGYKTQQGGILDSLIAKKMEEDKAIHQGRIDKFNGVDLPEYQKKRSYGENLVNKGIGNLFNAGLGASQDATVLARTNQNEKLFNKPTVTTPAITSPVVSTTAAPVDMNLSGILPSTYNTMGLGQLNNSPYQPITKGDGSLLFQPQSTINTPTVIPTVLNSNYNTGDMAYMSTPGGYSQYLSRVAKLTPEQILYPYQNTINPTTKQLYNINDVPAILKGMTDGKIGDKHRMAQSLLNQYGY